MALKREQLSSVLLDTLGKHGLRELLEHYAGCRLFVPKMDGEATIIIPRLSREVSLKLTERFSGDSLRIPIMRDFRALCLRNEGLTNGKIARRLGITESGVDSLFKRLRANRSTTGKPLSEHQRKLIEVASS